MYKRLFRCVREYKWPTFLTLFFIALEAVIECIIPAVTGNLITLISEPEGGVLELADIAPSGILLVVLALLSLCCGGIAGYTSAKASAGFAKNLRRDLFRGFCRCSRRKHTYR